MDLLPDVALRDARLMESLGGDDQQRQLSAADSKSSLEKIKKQLSAGSGNSALQGPLFKRSETLRKWNQRWFTLDPATGKMEYRLDRGDLSSRGQIYFDADSTITLSPINFHGAKKYDGCCFYIGTPHKKEYYLCAESQAVARAWVATLRASSLVLKAHKEAVNSLSGNGAAKLGTVAAVVTAANTVAKEAAKDIASEMQTSIKATLSGKSSQTASGDGGMDNVSIMKETLRVKDEELHQLSRELRTRDVTIKELADRLSETADAAEAAARAAHAMDKERKAARAEADRALKELDDRTKVARLQLKAGEERYAAVMRERDEALVEAQRWQKELAKAREQMLLMEAARIRQGAAASDAAAAASAAAAGEQKVSKEKMISEGFSHARPQENGDAGLEAAAPEENRHHEANPGESSSERASNPDAEQQQEEAVKSEDVQSKPTTVVETVPNEREVLIDTYSADIDRTTEP
ncbi:differentially expressed in FDCP 6 homolog [Selaginella moellendorffii]|uniref:differentially expressed in FDCP 6 homolog n=1 Tax=Selaginella moellendorffii TaxID=88036 RepID=UPI000D1CBEDA|nr:differentially expressed in FDCP 6 homolog [Selaginella moellendorffii]|eukprot:XP_002977913.2 differentially expressed in FDCP 6 homolog [Selaginella moellendorffii]